MINVGDKVKCNDLAPCHKAMGITKEMVGEVVSLSNYKVGLIFVKYSSELCVGVNAFECEVVE